MKRTPKYRNVRPDVTTAKVQGRLNDDYYIPVIVTDGGRSGYYRQSSVGDCVVRAIVCATGWDYKEVYDRVAHGNGRYHEHATARSGVYTHVKWFKEFMTEVGFEYVDLCANSDADDFEVTRINDFAPTGSTTGAYIIEVERHYMAYVDGFVYDSGVCSAIKKNEVVEAYWRQVKPLNRDALKFKKPKRQVRQAVYEYVYVMPCGEYVESDNMQEVINAAYKDFRPYDDERTPHFKCRRTRPAMKSDYWRDEETCTMYLADDGDRWEAEHYHDGEFKVPKAFRDKVKVCCNRFLLFADKLKTETEK